MKKVFKWVLILVALFFVVSIVVYTTASPEQKAAWAKQSEKRMQDKATPATVATAITEPETKAEPETKPATLNILLKAQGNGSKSSETFTLDGKTYFSYTYKSISSVGVFSAYLVPDGETWEDGNAIQIVSTNSVKVEADEVQIRAAKGDYYVYINAAGSWGFVIDKRK